MSEEYAFADIIAALPKVLDDILNGDRQPEIAMIVVLTETDEKCTADFTINTGPEDALRMLREAIDNLEQSIANDPETMQ